MKFKCLNSPKAGSDPPLQPYLPPFLAALNSGVLRMSPSPCPGPLHIHISVRSTPPCPEQGGVPPHPPGLSLGSLPPGSLPRSLPVRCPLVHASFCTHLLWPLKLRLGIACELACCLSLPLDSELREAKARVPVYGGWFSVSTCEGTSA